MYVYYFTCIIFKFLLLLTNTDAIFSYFTGFMTPSLLQVYILREIFKRKSVN